jgi:hypothetical protein
MKWQLLVDGRDICDLSFDDKGLGKCSMSDPEEVVIFCVYILNMIESLHNEHQHKAESQGAVHSVQGTDG